MVLRSSSKIRGIVFDLDGTLYVNEGFSALIQDAARDYVAVLRDINLPEAVQLMAETRNKLLLERGTVQTLSAVCSELGGTIQSLHRFFEENLNPEEFLKQDERVIRLLKQLKRQFLLCIYTNNNRALATRIVNHLGIEDCFHSIHAIDDAWRGKPDEEMLAGVLADIGLTAAETLFVGDRYDIDLRIPEQLGCPVYLSQSIEQLLRLEDLLDSTRGGT